VIIVISVPVMLLTAQILPSVNSTPKLVLANVLMLSLEPIAKAAHTMLPQLLVPNFPLDGMNPHAPASVLKIIPELSVTSVLHWTAVITVLQPIPLLVFKTANACASLDGKEINVIIVFSPLPIVDTEQLILTLANVNVPILTGKERPVPSVQRIPIFATTLYQLAFLR